MSTDYSKKKNAELEELLKSRSLPHTGKKADLVARLQQYDSQHSSTDKPAATIDAGGEDEIDWDDEASAPVAPTVGSGPVATAAIAAGGQGQADNPAAVPNQVVDTDPSKTDDLTIDPPAPTSASAADTQDKPTAREPARSSEAPPPPTDFTSGLSSTSLDDEIAKRKKRAARFNLKEDDDEALKALERAKKFGTGTAEDKTAIRGLDEALPERVKKERGVKRGREDTKDGRSDVKRRESGKRDNGTPARSTSRSKMIDGRQKRSGSRPKKTGKKGGDLSKEDRLAAEARKARFAQTS